MTGASLEGPPEPRTTTVSLAAVLHHAPRLYELLPQCSRQTLSATCSYLHKWVRGKITSVRIQNSDELSQIAPADWPNLVAVLLSVTESRPLYANSKRLLQGKWHLDVQVCFVKEPYWGYNRDTQWAWHNVVILISLLANSQKTGFDLTPAQCEILSRCVARENNTPKTS